MVGEIEKIKVAVVGSNGMLGKDLCLQLGQRGFFDVSEFDLPEVDIVDLDVLKATSGICDADVVFNCAAYTDVEKAEEEEKKATEINRDGIMNLIWLAEKYGFLLIHVSTDFVFDGKKREPYTEIDERNPTCAYGRSKLLGEIALEHSRCKWILIRTAWLYGIHGSNFVDKILSHAMKGNSVNVVADEYGSPTYTVDLAEAMIDLALAGKRGTFHCVNSDVASRFELALEAVQLANFNVFVRPVLEFESKMLFDFKAQRPKYSALDNIALQRTVGMSMRHWKEALAEYVGLWKQHRLEDANEGNTEASL
jgi:dTDP-4-dehydrorhamnose reductase